MFDLGRLQKVINTLSIIELEIKLVQFHENGFQSSQGLVQLNRRPMYECHSPIKF